MKDMQSAHAHAAWEKGDMFAVGAVCDKYGWLLYKMMVSNPDVLILYALLILYLQKMIKKDF